MCGRHALAAPAVGGVVDFLALGLAIRGGLAFDFELVLQSIAFGFFRHRGFAILRGRDRMGSTGVVGISAAAR